MHTMPCLSTLSNNEVATLYATTRNNLLKEEIVKRFEAMVCSICLKYRGRTYIEDMLQEGRIALIQALESYDPTEATFTTIAYIYVSGKIRHFLRDKASVIRVPAWIQDHYRREELTRSALEATFHRPPTDEEVARAMKIGVDRLRTIHQTNPPFFVHSDLDRSHIKKGTLSVSANLVADVFGNAQTQDDGFLDHDERLYLQVTPVSELMHRHRIGIVDARKLKDLASL